VRRGSAVVLAAVALLALGVSLSLVIRTIDDSEAPIQFNELSRQVPLSTARPHFVSQGGVPFGFSPKFKRPAHVTLLFNSINRNTQEASVTASVRVPPVLLKHLTTLSGESAIATREWWPHLTARSRRASLELRFLNQFPGAGDVRRRVSLRRFFDPRTYAPTVRIPLTLPLQGEPQAYPSDWYQLEGDILLWPTEPFAIRVSGSVPELPVVLSYAAGPAMRGTTLKVADGGPRFDASRIDAVIKTSSRSRDVAYGIAIIPTVLAAIALLLLLLDRRRTGSTLRGQEIALTLVLGVLAVLPIRQVTVPSELAGLTRVDLLLAFGVVAAVSVLLLALAIHLWRGSEGPLDSGRSTETFEHGRQV